MDRGGNGRDEWEMRGPGRAVMTDAGPDWSIDVTNFGSPECQCSLVTKNHWMTLVDVSIRNDSCNRDYDPCHVAHSF